MNRRESNRKLSASQRRRVQSITVPLGAWYRERQRDLPWRQNQDPYRVWISEIMLQQTQVKTVIPYYERFMTRFPDIQSLARADEDEVLEYWAGLGYYSRGRNLRRAAQQVIREHDGRIPSDPAGLRALPGIGEYTAAAIGSIAFDKAVAVIDGNVERVLARFLALDGDPKRGAPNALLREAAALSVPTQLPGDHNQAMMELGATLCTPRSPRCHACPIERHCAARSEGRPEQYPPPRKRRSAEIQFWLAAVVQHQQGIILRRATHDAPFLRGQWGVPIWLIDREPTPDEAVREVGRRLDQELGLSATEGTYATEVRHSITFRALRVHVVTASAPQAQPERTVLPESAVKLPGLHRKIIEAATQV